MRRKCDRQGRGRDSGNVNDDRKNILLHTVVKSLKTLSQYLYRNVCIQEGRGWWQTGESSATVFARLSVCLRFSHRNYRLKLARILLRVYVVLATAHFSRAMKWRVIQLHAATLAWHDGQAILDSNAVNNVDSSEARIIVTCSNYGDWWVTQAE